VLWSFGGWDGSAGFTAAARAPAAFAESCRALVEDPRWADVFDGVDIDWEYPNACGRGCDASGRDALGRLTGALRSSFGPDALVTAAVTGDGGTGGRVAAAERVGEAAEEQRAIAAVGEQARRAVQVDEDLVGGQPSGSCRWW
jgi:chitinase